MNLLDRFLGTYSQEYLQMKLGLHRVREALHELGDPHHTYSSILIAGTNGKGSVARMVESVLLQAGYRVGLYTSPHLVRFGERIRAGGKEAGKEELEAILQDIQVPIRLDPEGNGWTPSGEKLTWFEKTTILAFEYFRRKEIKLAILEVGLGGRLDATNVVDPLLSAITSISLDHTEVLGNSTLKIAHEKAGVMRQGKRVILGRMEEVVRHTLGKEAEQKGAIPILAKSPQGICNDFSYDGYSHLSIPLLGNHQMNNAAVAIELLKGLCETGFSFDEKAIQKGFSQIKHPGRLEWLSRIPPILLDGAHNSEALGALVQFLQKELPQKPVTLILAMMQDKDIRGALKSLRPYVQKIFFTEIDSARCVKISQWKEYCENDRIPSEFFTDPFQALQRAVSVTSKEGVIVVTGSLYLVGKIREMLRGGVQHC